MDLSKLLTISGKNGLFHVVSQSKTGLIVESLTDGKKFPVFATDRSSSLQDISVFTYGDDLPLKEILLRIFEKEEGKPCVDPKADPGELKAYFTSIVPDFDQERVYHSDLKKIFSWYNLLVEKELISREALVEQEEEDKEDDEKEAGDKALPQTSAPKKQTNPGGKNRQPDHKPSKIDTGKRKTLQKK